MGLFGVCTALDGQALANFGVLLTLLTGRVCQQVFFGPLRPMEVEVSPMISLFAHPPLISGIPAAL